METLERWPQIKTEPVEISDGSSSSSSSSSSESSAGDDEWRPCQRKIGRRVNLQRSKATKLMWKRKKAAARLQQQQQPQDDSGAGPSSLPGSSSPNHGGSAAIWRQSSMGTHPANAVSVTPSIAAQQMQLAQLPIRKRRVQTKMTDAGRYPMCWADTTLGSTHAGRSSVRTEGSHSNGWPPASCTGLKAYHHITTQSTAVAAVVAGTASAAAGTAKAAGTISAAGSARAAGVATACVMTGAASSSRTGAEMSDSQLAVNGESGRPGLVRACRPKVLKEEPTSSSEHSDDDCTAASLARRFEREASSPVRQLLGGGPRLRPRLLQTAQPQPGETVEQEFCVPHSSTIRAEDELHSSQETVAVPCHLYRGNRATESGSLVQGHGGPNMNPCTNKLVPLPGGQCRLWSDMRQEHQCAKEEEAAKDKVQSSAGSVQYTRESGGAQSLPSLLTMSFPFRLPAKLRWKQKMAAERLQVVLPPELHHKQHSALSAAGGEADVTVNLPTVVKIEPGTTGYAGGLETAPIVPTTRSEPKDPPSGRRSQAKRLWWQQVKQLDKLSGNEGSTPEKVEDVLSTLPKFLLAELFPDPTTTRGKRKPKAAAKAEGTPSQRSLIMKESWRRRKAAWLSAAEQSLAAASHPESASSNKDPALSGSSSSIIIVKEEPAEPPAEPEDTGPAEEGSQYLARTRALQRCRQYRHDLIAQADLQQRPGPPLRQYNARGIHIASNKDMCDCLRLECPGCHFPCPKCGSTKCGDECRCNRNFSYDQIEIDGRPGVVYVNPLLP